METYFKPEWMEWFIYYEKMSTMGMGEKILK